MSDQLWCADIIRSNHQAQTYRLSGDLQYALTIDEAGQRHLLHGLIVVPLAPYIFSKPRGTKEDVLPPYGVGYVKRVYRIDQPAAGQLTPTRSQFIDYKYWPNATQKSVSIYLQHDYSWLNKKQIDADIAYWQGQDSHRPVPVNRLWVLVSKYRIHRHLKRIAAYRKRH